jgi:hypothetical protein
VSEWIDLAVVGRIVLGALLLGAGLPAVFALGLRAVALAGSGPDRASGGSPESAAAGRGWLLLAGSCFVAVLVAVAVGLAFIVSG